jgi:ribosomal protein S18 acetylase RimI-like enzyme
MESIHHTPTFRIRQAEATDLEVLVDLRLMFLEEVNGGPAPDGLRESLHGYFTRTLASGEFRAWLAVSNVTRDTHAEQIVGTSGLVFMSRPPSHTNLGGRDAYIMNMYTLPACRGRGIGTALFGRVLEHIETSGCEKALLHATEQGRALYEKFGFRVPDSEVEMTLKFPTGHTT